MTEASPARRERRHPATDMEAAAAAQATNAQIAQRQQAEFKAGIVASNLNAELGRLLAENVTLKTEAMFKDQELAQAHARIAELEQEKAGG